MSLPEISLDNLWKIYYYIAIFSTILFVLKLIIFSVVGGDSEVSADFNMETDSDCSFNFVSIQSVIAFFMGFGWMGYAALKQLSMTNLMSFAVAFAVGFIFMFVSAALMFATKKLEKNVRKDKNSALNKIGKAYSNIPPHSLGQIEIEINGQLTVVNAQNVTDSYINSFEPVRVIKVVEDLLYIEKAKK